MRQIPLALVILRPCLAPILLAAAWLHHPAAAGRWRWRSSGTSRPIWKASPFRWRCGSGRRTCQPSGMRAGLANASTW